MAIVLSQTDIRVSAGTTTSFSVTAIDRNGAQSDVTAQAQVTSSNPGVATAAHGTGAQIVITAVGAGSAVITVTLGTLSQAAVVTVSGSAQADAGTPDGGPPSTGAQLTGITLSQTDIRIPPGANTAFAVTAIYSDGTHADVSQQCAVSSSNPGVATLQQGPGAQVQVFANNEGTAVITVTYGQFTQTANVTVDRHGR